MISLAELTTRLNAKNNGNSYSAKCPAHNDKTPSLSIGEGRNGGILLHCHAGCSLESICAELKIRPADLMPDSTTTSRTPAKTAPNRSGRAFTSPEEAAKQCTPPDYSLAAVYDYPKGRQPHGAVARYEATDDKTFRQFHETTAGKWTTGAPAGLWPLFRESELPADGKIYVVEGEKAALSAVSIGLPATTSAGGSKAAAKTDWTPLAGRDVVISPDNDETGEAYTADVSEILRQVTPPASVKIVRLPGLKEGGDLADFVEARHGQEPEAIRREIKKIVDENSASTTTTPDKSLDPIRAAKAGTPFAMTDLGNAERLVACHGESIRWDVARRAWRTWDGRRWALDSGLTVQGFAAKTARRIRQEAAATPKGEGKNDLGLELFNWAVRTESRDRLAAMIEVAKARPGIAVEAETLDADPYLLNVRNGTINLKTGDLKPHDRGDMLTKLAPVEYHPGQRDERFEKFLNDATGHDPDVITFLQVVSGYTLTGDTSEEKLFLIFGPEAAGKTTFLEALRACLGDYARTIQADLLTRQRESSGGGTASPELAALAGARLAAGSEMEQGREIAEALAKNLTGGEPITARHLYAELFDFRPQFKLWLAVNHCPRVSADDGAIWRRILRIGFEHTVPPEKRDKSLKPYLRDPNSGARAVLAWAIEGCLAWQRDGLNVPEAVQRSTAEYRRDSDPLALFIEDCLQFTPGAWTPWADIWNAYNEHAAETGTPERYRVAPKRLQERLRAHDCNSERRYSGRGWAGVELSTGWKSADHDGHDAYDTTSESFSMKEKIKKVSGKASYPTYPTCSTSQGTLDYETEERLAIQNEDAFTAGEAS